MPLEQKLQEAIDNKYTLLDLSREGIGDEGVKALAEWLKGSSVTSLNLNANKISDKGKKAIDLANRINDTQITYLNFTKNGIVYTVEQAVETAIKANIYKISKLVKRFEDIALNEDKFKDFSKIQENKKLEIIEIIKKYGINAFASHIKEFDKRFKDQDINKITAKLTEITDQEQSIKTRIVNDKLADIFDVNVDLPNVSEKIAGFLEIKAVALLFNATTNHIACEDQLSTHDTQLTGENTDGDV